MTVQEESVSFINMLNSKLEQMDSDITNNEAYQNSMIPIALYQGLKVLKELTEEAFEKAKSEDKLNEVLIEARERAKVYIY